MSELISQISDVFERTVDSVLDLNEVMKPVSELAESLNNFLPLPDNQGDLYINVIESFSGNDLFFVRLERFDEDEMIMELISQLTVRVNTYDIEVFPRHSLDEQSLIVREQLLPKVEQWIHAQFDDFMTLDQKREFLRLSNGAKTDNGAVPDAP